MLRMLLLEDTVVSIMVFSAYCPCSLVQVGRVNGPNSVTSIREVDNYGSSCRSCVISHHPSNNMGKALGQVG